MADQPDPPDTWRVYESDPTPDPEPAQQGAPKPAANVPYGSARASHPSTTVKASSATPRLVIVIIAVAVLGAGVAAAVAIFSAVGGVGGLGGIDAKDPKDFREFVNKLDDKTGSTDVFWVGLYDGYIIADVPYTDAPDDTREIDYRWDGGGLEKWSQGTSTDPRFDLSVIDPDVIDGMCDPVLKLADGAEAGDCYIFISQPSEGSNVWFRTSASDDFNISYWVNYDKDGVEVERGHS